ncbi:zeta toxin family protein [Microbacterium amylolyticum]|uniref:UDP-N-acetylglucosamine kinase n=1 Tax=Microbacterium amylolyticum TaxID=936337 RepID=A0ABS4ZI97_9MICO|nr:zeta toxin family protein [Microbacterium amylolyticum]MBP2436937.1 hypothetical protein [Microbacterium amylolyticum]
MARRSNLDQAELRALFEAQVRPSLDAASSPTRERPLFVIIGAQPGAGKSRSIEAVRREHPDVVPVIGDDLRPYHPDFRALMRSNPLAMPAVTQQASGAWVGMSAAHLREQRQSVLLETTMRQPSVVVATVREFRAAGYDVEVRGLAVPAEVSRLATVTRCLTDAKERGRWAPSTFHDAAYEAMPGTLEAVIASGNVDRAVVQKRSGQVLLDRRVTPEAAERLGAEARSAVEDGRDVATLTREDGRAWVHEYVRASTIMASGQQPEDPGMLRTMIALANGPARALIRATHEQGTEEQAAALEHVLAGAARLTPPSQHGRRAANPDTGPVTGQTPDGPSAGPVLR